MLLDLSLVTRTLITLIETHVASSPLAAKLNTLSVTAQSPDKLAGEQALGIYLYHLTEDPHYKNLPAPGFDEPPVRFTPMGLNLYYVLSASSTVQGSPGPEMEQTMMGAAVKALRDFPMVDDQTTIGVTQILHADLRGLNNRFRIVLQAVQSNDAVQYWTAGAQPLRLSAYYQVSVALLEPDRTRTRTGRVLAYGIQTFLRGSPRLDGSRNRISFVIPGETAPRTAESRPAEAAPGEKIEFFGSELTGDRTTLLIKDLRMEDYVEVSDDWGVTAGEGVVYATIQSNIGLLPALPGIYSAMARVITRRRMPDGQIREFFATSNATPFVIAPAITAIGPPNAQGIVLVQGRTFDDPDLKETDVELYIGPGRVPRQAAGPLAPGFFEVVDAQNLRFRFPIANVPLGQNVPLRLIIRGAENSPRWVQAI